MIVLIRGLLIGLLFICVIDMINFWMESIELAILKKENKLNSTNSVYIACICIVLLSMGV